jgi:hypothetical protein
MEAGPAHFRPFKGKCVLGSGSSGRPYDTDGLWEADHRIADVTNMPAIASAQRNFSRQVAQCR